MAAVFFSMSNGRYTGITPRNGSENMASVEKYGHLLQKNMKCCGILWRVPCSQTQCVCVCVYLHGRPKFLAETLKHHRWFWLNECATTCRKKKGAISDCIHHLRIEGFRTMGVHQNGRFIMVILPIF